MMEPAHVQRFATVYMPAEVADAVDEICRKEARKKSEFICACIQAVLAERARHEPRADPTNVITLRPWLPPAG